jgi:hypothetical protein
MSDAAQQPDGQPTSEHAAVAPETVAGDPAALNGAAPGASPIGAYSTPAPSTVDERPELLVGGAFAGGLVLALLLKRLAR